MSVLASVGRRGGKQPLLDGRGQRQLFFQLLLAHRLAEMPGVLKRHRGLRHQARAEFHVGFRIRQVAHAWAAHHQAKGRPRRCAAAAAASPPARGTMPPARRRPEPHPAAPAASSFRVAIGGSSKPFCRRISVCTSFQVLMACLRTIQRPAKVSTSNCAISSGSSVEARPRTRSSSARNSWTF